jgi:hypothetical protein
MDKLFKIVLLILVALIGYGYSAYNYFTSKDHLDGLPEIKGEITDISYFVVSETRLGDESEIQNLSTGKNKTFLKSEDVLKLIPKEQSENLFGKKVRYIDEIYDSINSSSLSIHEKKINIDSALVLTVRYKELEYSPKILIKIKGENSTFSLVPSLRDVTDGTTYDIKLVKLFKDLSKNHTILTIKGEKDSYFSEILNLEIHSIEEIKDQNDEVLYFFPFNKDYEIKMLRVTYYNGITTIVVLIILISLKFGWKISV